MILIKKLKKNKMLVLAICVIVVSLVYGGVKKSIDNNIEAVECNVNLEKIRQRNEAKFNFKKYKNSSKKEEQERRTAGRPLPPGGGLPGFFGQKGSRAPDVGLTLLVSS